MSDVLVIDCNLLHQAAWTHIFHYPHYPPKYWTEGTAAAPVSSTEQFIIIPFARSRMKGEEFEEVSYRKTVLVGNQSCKNGHVTGSILGSHMPSFSLKAGRCCYIHMYIMYSTYLMDGK